MKKLITYIGIIILILALGAGAFALYIEIDGIPSYPKLVRDPGITVSGDSAMLRNGERLGSLLCAQCHMNPETNVLTGQYMADIAQFGKVYSANITQDKTHGIGGWTDGELIYLLRTGVKKNGDYLPPWMPKFVHLSDYDLHSIIWWLRSDDARLKATPVAATKSVPNFLAKFLTHAAFKPLPYPEQPIVAPDSNDAVAYGKYIVQGKIECWTCHSASFKTLNILEPQKSPGYMAGGNAIPDMEGKIIYSANLTPDDETGIGRWKEEEFVKALRFGIRPDGTTNRYPMAPYTRMTELEAKAIFAYLKSLPPVHNPIQRTVN